MNIYHDRDATLAPLQGKKIAILGYGSQGHAHALNLRDSGMDVRVGLRADSASRKKAEAAGLRVVDTATAAREADVVMMLVPDEQGAEIYEGDVGPGSGRATSSPSATGSTSTTRRSSRPPT